MKRFNYERYYNALDGQSLPAQTWNNLFEKVEDDLNSLDQDIQEGGAGDGSDAFKTVTFGYTQLKASNSDSLRILEGLGIHFSDADITNNSIKINAEGKTYTAGDGIKIENDKVSLRTDFLDNNLTRSYGIRMTADGKPFVYVPWTDVIGPEQTEAKYYEQAFKNTAERVAPDAPGATFPGNGWDRYVVDDPEKPYVWMCTCLCNSIGERLDSWNGPWLISGPQGAPGTDGTGIEYVYTRTRTSDRPSAPLTNSQEDDYVPQGWTDRAQGVTDYWTCEWVGIRMKINDTWTDFNGPLLWSHYGHNGTDGDGVEYIYRKHNSANLSDIYNPKNWYGDLQYNTDEYIRDGSGWTDNPVDIDLGEYLFVSVRKYDGEAKQWGPYSDPAVWSYAGRDGQPGVVDGYAIDLTNENLPIGTSGGNVTHYEGHSLIQVYHNNVPVTEFTASIGTITRSDNTIGGTINATVNNNTKMITVTLENVTNFDGKSFEVPVTVNVGGADHVVTLTGYGVNSGVDGQSIELCTNVAAIRCDYTGTTCVPNSITPTVKITSGTSQQVEYGYSNNLGYSFEYSYVDGATISSRAAVNGPVLIAGYHDAIIFYLKYTDANNITTEIDSELVPFVKDGAPGIKGADFINYAIDVQQSTMVVEDGNVSGTITYKVFKDDEQFGANGFEHTDGETVVVKVNDAVRTATYGNNVWTVTVLNEPLVKTFASITIYKASTAVGDTAIIPFSIKGPQGNSQPAQPLTGVVMRVAEYTQGSTYYNGTTPSPDGIKYKDIVGDMYNGVHSYFYLVETQEYESVNTRPITPGQNGNSDTITTGWIVFNAVDAEFIRTLIAENAYITNLTAKQIVVTNNSGVPVAGVVSGQPIPTEIYDGTLNGSETTANHSGVRFFAGAPGNNNNLEDCNFVVREDGSGFAAGGNISWDNSGNFNFNIYNGGGYGQNMMSNCVVIERMEWTSDDTLNGPFNQIMLHICIVKNSFVVWYSTLILPYDDAVNCIREDDVILGSLPAATLLRKLGENQLIQQFFEVGTNVFVHAIDPKVYAPVSIGNNSLTLLGGIQFNHTIEWIPVSRLYWNGASAYITWPAVNAQSTMTVVTDYAPAVYQGSAAPTETDPNQVDPHNNP